MNYGLTDKGFRVKRQQQILLEMQTDTLEKFGNVQTDPESVIGQQLGVYSKPATDNWEQLGRIYSALNPVTATGISLDFCCAFNGIKRLGAIPSTGFIGLKGTLTSLIPAGTLVKSNLDGNLFSILFDATLSESDLSRAYMQINSLDADTTYSFAINDGVISVIVTTDSGSVPDYDNIVDDLIDQMNTNDDCIASGVNLGLGCILLLPKGQQLFNVIETSSMFDFYNSVQFQSVNLGAIPVSIRTINLIETPVTGLDSVNNFEQGTKGRNRETDAELRLRRADSLQIAGAAVLNAIVSRMIREVEGVTTCKGYENVEDYEVDDRPPHSIEIIVQGGTDHDIATQLWNTKGGGIKTFGNTSHDIIDSNGDPQTMYFSRPIVVYGWVQVSIYLYDEEIYPTNGNELVRQYLLEYGLTHTIGLDIIPQRFVPKVLLNVPGIDHIDILVARTDEPDDTPVWQGTSISIAATEIAVFSLDRIELPS